MRNSQIRWNSGFLLSRTTCSSSVGTMFQINLFSLTLSLSQYKYNETTVRTYCIIKCSVNEEKIRIKLYSIICNEKKINLHLLLLPLKKKETEVTRSCENRKTFTYVRSLIKLIFCFHSSRVRGTRTFIYSDNAFLRKGSHIHVIQWFVHCTLDVFFKLSTFVLKESRKQLILK